MKNVVLFIDTSRNDRTIVGLVQNGKRKEKRMDGFENSQEILVLIESLVREEGRTLGDIEEIHVYVGPGSYTGLRIGASVARTLSLLLSIPINGMPPGSSLPLIYM